MRWTAVRLLAVCLIALSATAILRAGAGASVSRLPTPTDPSNVHPTAEGVAQDLLEDLRADNFADWGESELTTAQSAQVVIGPADYACSVDLARVGPRASIFESLTEDRTWVDIPFLLGDRRIGEVGVQKTTGGWEQVTTCRESDTWGAARRKAMAGFVGALRGAPETVREVYLLGSYWLVAKRGHREAASLISYSSYGCSAGGANPPKLGREGDVITQEQFRALTIRLRDYTASQMLLQRLALGSAVFVLTAFVTWRTVRRRRSA
jgi:hypothetical protein